MCEQCDSLKHDIRFKLPDQYHEMVKMVQAWLDEGIIVKTDDWEFEKLDDSNVWDELTEESFSHHFVCQSCEQTFSLIYNIFFSGPFGYWRIPKEPPSFTLFTLHEKLYFDTGELQYEGSVRSGIPYGQGIKYFRNGQIHMEGWFDDWFIENGKEYYENGNLRFEGEYNKGPRTYYGPRYFVKGKLYYESGELWYEGTFHIERKGNVGFPVFEKQKSFQEGTEYDKQGKEIARYPVRK